MQLICGDAIEEMQKLPEHSVDLVLTDPPYGVTACKWDSAIPLGAMWRVLHRIIKPGGGDCAVLSNAFFRRVGTQQPERI